MQPEVQVVGGRRGQRLRPGVAGGAAAVENVRLQVTISLGVATAVRPASPKPDEVVRRADVALYEAKTTGKNRVLCAPPEEDPPA